MAQPTQLSTHFSRLGQKTRWSEHELAVAFRQASLMAPSPQSGSSGKSTQRLQLLTQIPVVERYRWSKNETMCSSPDSQKAWSAGHELCTCLGLSTETKSSTPTSVKSSHATKSTSNHAQSAQLCSASTYTVSRELCSAYLPSGTILLHFRQQSFIRKVL